VLDKVDPAAALVITPCSARKAAGGGGQARAAAWLAELQAARDGVRAVAGVDDAELMPAVQRYRGNFYTASGSAAEDAARDGRLLILSGGYGLVEGDEPHPPHAKQRKHPSEDRTSALGCRSGCE
jgi:hypothetical protein